MRALSRLCALLSMVTIGSACSKSALSAGDAAIDAPTSNDLGSTNSDVQASDDVDSTRADVPPDATLTPPPDFAFPEAPQMSCGNAGDCQFPPSACGRPSCDGGQCFDPGWVVYYDDPTCQGGQCAFTQHYFACSGGMGCAMGGCFFNVTIP